MAGTVELPMSEVPLDVVSAFELPLAPVASLLMLVAFDGSAVVAVTREAAGGDVGSEVGSMPFKMASVIVTSTDGRAGATDVTVEVVAVAAVVVISVVDVVVVDNDDNVAAVVTVGKVRSVAVDMDVATSVSAVAVVSDVVAPVVIVPVGAAVVDAVTFDVDGPLS